LLIVSFPSCSFWTVLATGVGSTHVGGDGGSIEWSREQAGCLGFYGDVVSQGKGNAVWKGGKEGEEGGISASGFFSMTSQGIQCAVHSVEV